MLFVHYSQNNIPILWGMKLNCNQKILQKCLNFQFAKSLLIITYTRIVLACKIVYWLKCNTGYCNFCNAKFKVRADDPTLDIVGGLTDVL